MVRLSRDVVRLSYGFHTVYVTQSAGEGALDATFANGKHSPFTASLLNLLPKSETLGDLVSDITRAVHVNSGVQARQPKSTKSRGPAEKELPVAPLERPERTTGRPAGLKTSRARAATTALCGAMRIRRFVSFRCDGCPPPAQVPLAEYYKFDDISPIVLFKRLERSECGCPSLANNLLQPSLHAAAAAC